MRLPHAELQGQTPQALFWFVFNRGTSKGDQPTQHVRARRSVSTAPPSLLLPMIPYTHIAAATVLVT